MNQTHPLPITEQQQQQQDLAGPPTGAPTQHGLQVQRRLLQDDSSADGSEGQAAAATSYEESLADSSRYAMLIICVNMPIPLAAAQDCMACGMSVSMQSLASNCLHLQEIAASTVGE